MSYKTCVVLFQASGDAEIHEGEKGIALPLMGLINTGFEAIYVATSRADAQFAIDYYNENGNLENFIKGVKE